MISPGVIQVNMWIARLIQSTSVMIAVRFHARGWPMPSVTPAFVSSTSAPGANSSNPGADREQHPHLPRLGRLAHRR
jgi:hypothetical protein